MFFNSCDWLVLGEGFHRYNAFFIMSGYCSSAHSFADVDFDHLVHTGPRQLPVGSRLRPAPKSRLASITVATHMQKKQGTLLRQDIYKITPLRKSFSIPLIYPVISLIMNFTHLFCTQAAHTPYSQGFHSWLGPNLGSAGFISCASHCVGLVCVCVGVVPVCSSAWQVAIWLWFIDCQMLQAHLYMFLGTEPKSLGQSYPSTVINRSSSWVHRMHICYRDAWALTQCKKSRTQNWRMNSGKKMAGCLAPGWVKCADENAGWGCRIEWGTQRIEDERRRSTTLLLRVLFMPSLRASLHPSPLIDLLLSRPRPPHTFFPQPGAISFHHLLAWFILQILVL